MCDVAGHALHLGDGADRGPAQFRPGLFLRGEFAHHADQGTQQGFSPATGISSYSVPGNSSGALHLTLGQDPGTGSCTVDVGTLQAGGLFKTYTGNIVATVTVL